MNFLQGLKTYVTDWKNLLVHALIGVGILAAAAFLPVPVWARVSILAGVITFNILRMRFFKKAPAAVNPEGEKP